MKCPRCYVQLGGVRTEEGVSVDFCRDCGGVWLDEGELSQLLNMVGASPQLPTTSKPLDGLRCPSCKSALSEVEHPPETGVLLDSCSACKGVWLDRGEIGKLQQLSRTTEGRSAFTAVASAQATTAEPSPAIPSDLGGKRDLLIPLLEVQTTTAGTGLHPKWLVISTLVMCAALGLVSVITEALWIAEEVSSADPGSSHLWVIVSSGIAFAVGGFMVGWRSPGHTVLEPMLATIPAALAFGVLFADMFNFLELGFILALGIVLGLMGGVAGERFQTS